MAFRLQTLLDLKLRAEEDARTALATAVKERTIAEEQQARLERQTVEARTRVSDARREFSEPADRVADQMVRDRFRQRLDDELQRKVAASREHRVTALARARAAETAAQAALLEARREREALEKHKEKEEERARRLEGRRAEDAASDLALAAYHVRKPR
jgi:flagellar biosynthesis chaperone FliJ